MKLECLEEGAPKYVPDPILAPDILLTLYASSPVADAYLFN